MPVERAAQNAGAAPAEDDCCEPPVTRVGRANRSQGCIGGHATTVVSDMELQPPSVGALRGGQPTLGQGTPGATAARPLEAGSGPGAPGAKTPARLTLLSRAVGGPALAGLRRGVLATGSLFCLSRALSRPSQASPRVSAGTSAPFAADCPGARLLGLSPPSSKAARAVGNFREAAGPSAAGSFLDLYAKGKKSASRGLGQNENWTGSVQSSALARRVSAPRGPCDGFPARSTLVTLCTPSVRRRVHPALDVGHALRGGPSTPPWGPAAGARRRAAFPPAFPSAAEPSRGRAPGPSLLRPSGRVEARGASPRACVSAPAGVRGEPRSPPLQGPRALLGDRPPTDWHIAPASRLRGDDGGAAAHQ